MTLMRKIFYPWMVTTRPSVEPRLDRLTAEKDVEMSLISCSYTHWPLQPLPVQLNRVVDHHHGPFF